MKKIFVDITVNQKPVDVSFECPCCNEEISIDYVEFIGIADEPADWHEFECPECEKVLTIDSTDWC